jgi:hypothetical protein
VLPMNAINPARLGAPIGEPDWADALTGIDKE